MASSIFLYLESMMSLTNLMLSAQYVILNLNTEHETRIGARHNLTPLCSSRYCNYYCFNNRYSACVGKIQNIVRR